MRIGSGRTQGLRCRLRSATPCYDFNQVVPLEMDALLWDLSRRPAMLRSYLFPYFANPSCVFVFAVSALSCGAEPLRDELEPFLEENCFDCHDDETSEGGLSLLDLEFAPGRAENFKIWERVFDRIGSDEMPPKNKPRPDAAAKAVVLEKLEAPLLAADRENKAARGRVNMRGLTRREYEHTVHDLLGVDLPLQELLPEDPATHGFETVASGQQLSHFNLASYLEAADLALDEAFGRAIRGDREFKRSIEAAMLGKAGAGRGNFRGPETRDGQSIAWPIRIQFYGRMPATRVPESGWYRITLTDVQAVNAVSGSAWGTLRSGACASNEPMLYPVGIVEATAERRDLSYSAWIREGHMLELKPNDSTRKSAPTGATGGNVSYKGRDLKEAGFEGIAISGIEIERIYPNAERWQIRKLLLGDLSKEDAMALMATSGSSPACAARAGDPPVRKPRLPPAGERPADRSLRRACARRVARRRPAPSRRPACRLPRDPLLAAVPDIHRKARLARRPRDRFPAQLHAVELDAGC